MSRKGGPISIKNEIELTGDNDDKNDVKQLLSKDDEGAEAEKSDLKREATEVLETKEEEEDEKEALSCDKSTKLKPVDSIGGISGRVANLRLKTLSCVLPPNEVGVSNSSSYDEPAKPSAGTKIKRGVTANKRGRGRGGRRTSSRRDVETVISPSKTISEATSADTVVADTADLLQEEESPDLPSLGVRDGQSNRGNKSHDHEEEGDKRSDRTNESHDNEEEGGGDRSSLSTASSPSLNSSQSGRGKRGRGRGGASKRGKGSTATPKRKSSGAAPKSG